MKIIFEQEKCIGCGSCAALCSKYFELNEKGKSNLKGSKIDSKTKNQELEIAKIECAKEAATSCPMQIIQIIE